MTDDIEQNLLRKIADGSEAAFSQLFHAYRNKLYSFIHGISGSRQLSEDIVQEVFLKIWQKRSEIKYINNFDAYLFRMARNHALNSFKRMAKETLILNEIGQQSPESADLPEALDLKEMTASVRDAIDKLPGRQKEVFILSRERGLKQAEISQMLNITIPTVKSHMTQAMLFIRKQCKNIYPTIIIFLALLPGLPK